MDHRTFLRVKIKSLACEAGVIRREESKARARGDRELRMGLASHRREIVRPAARETLLAYGFLRGMPYERIEAKCHLPPNWKAVSKMVSKYGDQEDPTQAERFEKWKKIPSKR